MLFHSSTWCVADVSVRFLNIVLFLTMTLKLFPTEFQRNFSGIPMESHGIHWELFPEAPGFRPFPSEFLGIKWEFPWKWKPKWLRLQPNAFHRNSMEFCGIPTFQWESSGICRNSWRRVKTSHCCTSASCVSAQTIHHGWPTPMRQGEHAEMLKLQMDMNLDMDMVPSPPKSLLLCASGAPNLVLRMPNLALEMLSFVAFGIPLQHLQHLLHKLPLIALRPPAPPPPFQK